MDLSPIGLQIISAICGVFELLPQELQVLCITVLCKLAEHDHQAGSMLFSIIDINFFTACAGSVICPFLLYLVRHGLDKPQRRAITQVFISQLMHLVADFSEINSIKDCLIGLHLLSKIDSNAICHRVAKIPNVYELLANLLTVDNLVIVKHAVVLFGDLVGCFRQFPVELVVNRLLVIGNFDAEFSDIPARACRLLAEWLDLTVPSGRIIMALVRIGLIDRMKEMIVIGDFRVKAGVLKLALRLVSGPLCVVREMCDESLLEQAV
jgi:hypothetical protein